MLAEVANYANDAGMLILSLLLAVFRPVRVPRGSYLPSESFACIREMMSLRAAYYAERARDGKRYRDGCQFEIWLYCCEMISSSISLLDNLSYVIVMVGEMDWRFWCIAAVEKSLRLLQALVQIAAGTTSSAADAKKWTMARGHFALGTLSFHKLLYLFFFSLSTGVVEAWRSLSLTNSWWSCCEMSGVKDMCVSSYHACLLDPTAAELAITKNLVAETLESQSMDNR
jgi:hypothetical protein